MKKQTCALIFSAIFLLTTCDQPVGLGSLVNMDFPVINNRAEGVQPGDYLSGNSNMVYLEIIQKFGIGYVFMTIFYNDYAGAERQRVIPVSFDEEGNFYYADIDTTGMADGAITARVTAVDIDGKSTTTTDIIYIVKNNPPQIEMSLPSIQGEGFDVSYMNEELEPIFMGGDLMGMASDVFGIESGYPQILLWPADYSGEVDQFGIPLPADLKWGQWRTVTDDKYRVLDRDGARSLQFRWPLIELEEIGGQWQLPDIANNAHFLELRTGRYRFKIRVLDKLGVMNTYPNRLDNSHGYAQIDERLNHYMEISIVSPAGPTVRFQNVPQYYNGSVPFEATMIITSANHISGVRAGISNNENTAGMEWIEAEHVEGNIYKVTIPFENIPDTQGAGAGIKTGEKVLHVEAADESGVTDDSRSFTVDDLPPDLEFLEPAGMGTSDIPKVTSTVIIRGISNDNVRVARLYYALGITETNTFNLNLDENPMDMEMPELNPGRGWIDTLLHTDNPVFVHPGQGHINLSWGGNQFSWNLRFEDISDLTRFPTQVRESGGIYYGNYYVSNYDGLSNLWRLPVYFKAVDVAGNVRIYKEELIIDPDADSPVVEIRSHENEQSVGGAVRVNGIARDNEMLYAVEVRVFKQPDIDCDTMATPSIPVTNGFVPVNIVGNMGSTVSWFYNLNQDGDLNPPPGGTFRRVTLEFRAADASIFNPYTFKHYGAITELTIRIDNTVPIIENETIIRGIPSLESLVVNEPYVFGSRVSGFVTLKATVRGQEGLSSVLMNLQGTSNYVELLGTSPNDVTPFMTPPVSVGSDSYFESTVYIPLNTKEILNGRYANSAGSYEIALQVTDGKTTPYMAHRTFTLYIDNYSPLASYNGYLNASGNSYSISGTAWDIGDNITVQGVEMVVVYFSRGGSGVPLNEKIGGGASWVNSQIVKQNRRGDISSVTQEGELVTLPFFPDVRRSDGTFATTHSGIVIKDSGDSGGYFTTFTGNPVREWSASFDSNQLNDGPVTLNYVVFDTAGNASLFTQEIYVANNRPMISSIDLGTDIQAIGSAQFTSFSVQSGEITTNFRIRNNLFSLNIDTLYGNGSKFYRVFYTSKNAPVPVNAIVKGNVYTIADSGNIEWINYGVFDTPPGNFYNGITFVATTDYLGYGEGAVYSYTHAGNANTVRTGSLTGHSAFDINFESGSFGAAPLITDSVDSADSNGNPILNRNRYFVIKVYDSTVPGLGEENQLSQAVVINADVNNTDIIKPKISINPFFWNNASANSLYMNSKANGHIEYESDLDVLVFNQSAGLRDTDPKVSGIISIRGSAFDENAIGNIYFKIDGFTDSGAELGSASAAGYYRAAFFYFGLLTGVDRFQSAGWKFSITNATHNMSGHNVLWQLDFDTSRIAGITALDREIKVIASDRRPNYSDTSETQTTVSSPTPHYRVDIVPYISAIETNDSITGGLKANNIRSADGKYSIIQGNNGNFITVRGFNLNPSGVRILNETQNNTYRNNPSSVPAGTVNVSFNAGTFPYTSFTMTNNVSRSGYLTVIVNGTGTLNNINNTNAVGSYRQGTAAVDQVHMPNRRADPNVTRNNTLTDDVYLQFYTVKKTDAADGFYPVMMMEGDDVVFGYVNEAGGGVGWAHIGYESRHGNYEARHQRAKYNLNADNIYTDYLIKMTGARSEQMGMTRDDSGRYLHAVNYDDGGGNLNLVYDRYSGIYDNLTGYDDPAYNPEERKWFVGKGIPGRYAINSFSYGENVIGLEPNNLLPNPLVSRNRYQYPKLIARGNSITSFANYYMSYYDAALRQIVFRNFRIGTWNNVRQNLADNADNRQPRRLFQTSETVSGRHSPFDFMGRPFDSFTNLGANDGDRRRMIASANGHNGITNFFDMAVDSVGRAVIVYFDERESRLFIRYSSILDGTVGDSDRYDGSGVFSGTRQFTFTDLSVQMPHNVGPHVSMTIDQNRLHIAAFDLASSSLRYIFVDNFDSLAFATVTSVTVDQYGSVGSWADIKIHPSGRPYIAYYNTMETGTREAVKIAWAKNPVTGASSVRPGVNSGGFTTGDWEYRTVPTIDPTPGGDPRFQKVNLQFRPNGDPVLGYLGRNLEFSYPVGE